MKREEGEMEPLPRCLLLPIDGTVQALLPITFVSRLYPDLNHIDLVLCYFTPPLPPVYEQRPLSKGLAQKKGELIKSREKDARAALDRARRVLLRHGFPPELIQEHVQQKAMSVAHHACQIADIRKVDAVLVQKKTTDPLTGLLMDDPSDALLRYCIVSPVWFIEGDIDPSKAAICLQQEAACLRAVDHAGFMLATTEAAIDLVHVSHAAPRRITSPASEPSTDLKAWLETPAGKTIAPLFAEAHDILKEAGVADPRIQMTILPGKEQQGKVASRILSYAKEQGTGILVLGHSSPEGVWSFLKTSVTRKILSRFENMAVWVNQ